MKYKQISIPSPKKDGSFLYAHEAIKITCIKCCFQDVKNTSGCVSVLEDLCLPSCLLLTYYIAINKIPDNIKVL